MKLRHVFLYIAVVSIAVLSSNTAWAQTAITGCTTITQPGPYVLKNNITATAADLKPIWPRGWGGCIVIAADFVTINLSDYVITGPGDNLDGRVGIAQDKTTLTGDVVQGGSVTGFTYGILLEGTAHTIKDVNASKNHLIGIVVSSPGNRIIGNTANNDGGYGIIAGCSNLLLENMAYGNQLIDIKTCNSDVRQENFPAP